ncbi:chorion class B protein Ld34-like [Anticarsia gemmatalis]|uniref:chorion class B protein Ld34-like n=1 Tax=Anticarsia gemmatalis TaxID=129554 RepID=UPI003F770A41
MSAKTIFILCAQTLLVQSVFSQCANWAGLGIASPFAYDGLAGPYGYDRAAFAGRGLAYDGIYPAMAPAMDFTPTSGGGLPVTSASAIAPTGISIVSENTYEGILAVAGELPFVGTTSVEGVLPTAGAGAINHDCGNGLNAMVSF